MKFNNKIKRVLLFVVSMFLALWSFAQTQYDYYEGKDAYGGVDTAIKGLKIIGIIILVVAIIVIVGGIWAKTMDFFNPPKKGQSQTKPIQDAIKQKNESSIDKMGNAPIAPKQEVVITIEGKTIMADVTMIDGSKTTEWYWYEIDSIIYNLTQDITYIIGDEIVKPAGSTHRGSHINKEDVKLQTIESFKCSNLIRIHGAFDPKKLQLIRIDGLGIYDRWVYYYDGEGQMQSIVSDKEAEIIAKNTI